MNISEILTGIKNWVVGKLELKQDTLTSGTNIKTINNTSLLGSGNINISGESLWEAGSAANSVQQKGTGITASGVSSLAGGYTNLQDGIEARGDGSLAFGYNTVSGKKVKATGVGAIAMGVPIVSDVEATSNYSVAIGQDARAIAEGAIGLGNGGWAMGTNSLAICGRAYDTNAKAIGGHAQGKNSITIGLSVYATKEGSIAFGKYNKYDSNTQFSIGAGTSDSTRRNLLEIYSDKFYVKGLGTYDGTNPVSGTNDVKSIIDGKASASQLVWEAGTGTSSVKQKDSNGIASGNYSVVAGYTNQTNGLRAINTGTFALGYNVKSGKQINASGVGAIAIGSVSDESYSDSILASRKYTVAIGNGSQATGDYSMAIGRLCVASAERSVAMGNEAHATGKNSFSLRGYADGPYSVSIGGRAVAERSITMGDGTRTARNNSIAIGAYNRYDTDVQFAVGVGTADTARVNALEVCADKFYVKGLGTYNGTNPVSGTNDVGTIIDSKASLTGSSTQDFAAKDLTVSHLKYNGQTFNLNPTQGGQLALTTDITTAQARPQTVTHADSGIRFCNGAIVIPKDFTGTATIEFHTFFSLYCQSIGANPDDYSNLGIRQKALMDFLYQSFAIVEHIPAGAQDRTVASLKKMEDYYWTDNSSSSTWNVFITYGSTNPVKLYIESQSSSPSDMQVRITA